MVTSSSPNPNAEWKSCAVGPMCRAPFASPFMVQVVTGIPESCSSTQVGSISVKFSLAFRSDVQFQPAPPEYEQVPPPPLPPTKAAANPLTLVPNTPRPFWERPVMPSPSPAQPPTPYTPGHEPLPSTPTMARCDARPMTAIPTSLAPCTANPFGLYPYTPVPAPLWPNTPRPF